jgi:hypothetical protein
MTKCQVDGQIYSQHPTTTDELCSMLLTGKGSVIAIINKLGYVKSFTLCVPLILTNVHKEVMKTILLGLLWHYSVKHDDSQEIRHGFIIWKQGLQGITLCLQGWTHSLSSAVKIMASFLGCEFLTCRDHREFKTTMMTKKTVTLNLTNLS